MEVATIGLVTSIVGAVASGYSAYSQANAQKQAANYQAAVARNNATVAGWQAQDAITRGQNEAQRVQLQGLRLKSRQQAAMAERGLDLSVGSPLELLADTSWMTARDSATATDNASREAYGYTVKGQNAEADARLYQYKADTTSPGAAAAGSLLSSAGSISDKWYKLYG